MRKKFHTFGLTMLLLSVHLLGHASDQALNTQVIPSARITVYWKDSDPDTAQLKSSSGVRLRESHIAVDPALIPYGSTVRIEGWGVFTAVDTGSAVKRRTAARKLGRDVPVIDVFFLSKEDALRASQQRPLFSKVEILSKSPST
jgi:3D (Asp-Asp-Asp) domain-containing protein